MRKNTLTLGLIIAITTLLTDQLSKWVILEILALPTREPIVITSFFRFTMVWNRGMSFGMLSSLGEYAPHFFTVVALSISGALLWWMRKETRLWLIAAQGLIIGGAIGNVIDRWRFGAVADFLDVHIGAHHWPAFNIADSAIFIGVALLMWDAFKGSDQSSEFRVQGLDDGVKEEQDS